MAVGRIVVLVEETAPPDSEPSLRRTFNFDSSGTLTRAAELKSQLVSNGNASPSMLQAKTELEFLGNGTVRSRRRVNGVEKPVQPWDVDNLQRHADVLLELARRDVPRR